MTTSVARPLRRDAARNRQLIIDTATAVLAEQGLQASMNDVAARAGVGVGTVYRRFPDRLDLIKAVFEQRLASIGEVLAAAAEDEDPWRGLVTFLEDTIESGMEDLGLSQLLDDPSLRAWVIGSSDPLRVSAAQLLARAQAAGTLRTDVELGDILLLKRMVLTAARTTEPSAPGQWRRTLALALDGLRAERATPLPGSALTDEQMVEVMRAGRP